MGISDAELERALVDLGAHLSYPAVPDLARAVGAHLAQHPHPRRMPFLRRAVLYPLLAGLLILGSILTLSPGARSAVASWFHIPGVLIGTGPTPQPIGRDLRLGRQVSLAEAEKQVAFPVLIPSLPGLGRPDEIYLGAAPAGHRVSLLYRVRAGLPRASTTGAGLLITEFSSKTFFLGKMLQPGTTIRQVFVDRQPGAWIAGAPHVLYYVNPRGVLVPDTTRLAGNALLWQRGGLTLRLEGRMSEQQALAIARSMKHQ
jgi:hypothetical protein